MNKLEILQYTCLLTTLIFGLQLCCIRIDKDHTGDNSYMKSKWLFVSGFFTLAIHYACQLKFGFRAEGDDSGTMFNLLFYFPALGFFYWAFIRLLHPSKSQRNTYWAVSILGYITMLICFVVGYIHYGNFHLDILVYVCSLLFMVFVLYCVSVTHLIYHQFLDSIEENFAYPLQKHVSWIRNGAAVYYISTLCTALFIYNRSFLYVLAVVVFSSMVYNVTNFIRYASIANVIAENTYIDTATPREEEEQAKHHTATNNGNDDEATTEEEPLALSAVEEQTQEDEDMVKNIIEKWKSHHGYLDNDITTATLAHRIGIPRYILSRYVKEVEKDNFRGWINRLRIDYSIQLMKENPNFSIDAVAEQCGFSSRNYFHKVFHDIKGMTPMQYLG